MTPDQREEWAADVENDKLAELYADMELRPTTVKSTDNKRREPDNAALVNAGEGC